MAISKPIFKKNNTDGIGGNKQTTPNNTQAATNPQATVQGASGNVTQAHVALQNQLRNAPGAYQSKWQTQMDDIMNAYRNRGDFQYDLNSDALYQQYADQYAQRGKLAMMDTMGQAQAMTGGYGNSYAATAGNQAYQSYLQQLNDVVPELYGMAYDRHQQEGQDMLTEYSLLSDREKDDYSKYQDQLNRYYTDRDYLANRYDSERAYSQWQQEFDFQKNQYNNSLKAIPGGVDEEGKITTAGVPESVKTKASTFSNNNDLASYLDGITAAGLITEAQADALYAEHMTPEQAALQDRKWKMENDGGVNWFGGIDNNAVVKDNYGNTYRLDKLKEALIAEGMGKDEAKDYIKMIQKELGA